MHYPLNNMVEMLKTFYHKAIFAATRGEGLTSLLYVALLTQIEELEHVLVQNFAGPGKDASTADLHDLGKGLDDERLDPSKPISEGTVQVVGEVKANHAACRSPLGYHSHSL